jgi:type IV pilus assembly protein PilX
MIVTMRRFRHWPTRRRNDRGVVVLIALIAMLALGYAGMALMRNVDAVTAVTGNIERQQGATLATDIAVEHAIAALFERTLIADLGSDQPSQSYYASRQAQEDARGVPFALQKLANYPEDAPIVDGDDGNSVRYVIERMCMVAGPPSRDTCVLTPALDAAAAGTTTSPEPAPIPLFRQTIRIDGPAGTTLYAQAWLADAVGRRRLSWRAIAE